MSSNNGDKLQQWIRGEDERNVEDMLEKCLTHVGDMSEMLKTCWRHVRNVEDMLEQCLTCCRHVEDMS